MIMPANYSVIAENELTYVDGGAFEFLVDPINDGGKQLTTNVVKWIGSGYANATLNTLIGVWFYPDTTDEKSGIKGALKSGIKNLFQNQILDSDGKYTTTRTLDKVQYGIANAVGVASAIWVLGKYDGAVKVDGVGGNLFD
jgi:hypothetical protein